MPYAQRDQSGDIIALFANPQPEATEEVPDGTTLTEKRPERIKRELTSLIKTFPDSEQEAIRPVFDQIMDYIQAGKLGRAGGVVDNIGVLPVVSPAHKQELKAKIQEAAG